MEAQSWYGSSSVDSQGSSAVVEHRRRLPPLAMKGPSSFETARWKANGMASKGPFKKNSPEHADAPYPPVGSVTQDAKMLDAI
ncbi:uncharacterized protein N7473_009084 [Penicillium subrubescens]|uniref:Uncharacterized protein n=1 Tax=Penicillium subrubescens TaxID=1316194 RepID=A0A1Q5UGC3_9EURO|nr:uncharacterized protein N7473_009084 [Penicillium subrubescens]KAJ5886410.1 hypothetical protein N7473_009084 [Penicillium subrubescens]OKP11535.1 hypothetical protein PENSUB_3021 [Penicillium subrubescens]